MEDIADFMNEVRFDMVERVLAHFVKCKGCPEDMHQWLRSEEKRLSKKRKLRKPDEEKIK
jgi:hypothetical protein